MKESQQIVNLIDKLKILGDPVRFRIARIVANRPLSVNEITEILRLPQPTISRKLSELKRVDILTYEKEGKQIFYTVSQDFNNKFPLLKNVLVSAQAREFTADLEKLHSVIRKRPLKKAQKLGTLPRLYSSDDK